MPLQPLIIHYTPTILEQSNLMSTDKRQDKPGKSLEGSSQAVRIGRSRYASSLAGVSQHEEPSRRTEIDKRVPRRDGTRKRSSLEYLTVDDNDDDDDDDDDQRAGSDTTIIDEEEQDGIFGDIPIIFTELSLNSFVAITSAGGSEPELTERSGSSLTGMEAPKHTHLEEPLIRRKPHTSQADRHHRRTGGFYGDPKEERGSQRLRRITNGDVSDIASVPSQSQWKGKGVHQPPAGWF